MGELPNEQFSNFQLFGIGKPSAAQSERRDKRKEKFEDLKEKVKEHNPVKALKKAGKKIHELVGKAKEAMQKRMRKGILKRVSAAIRKNAHGMATRLYPATINEGEALKSKYKRTFIAKSKNSYNELLTHWIKLGGTKQTLDEAIKVGATHKRMHMFKNHPYPGRKSGIDGNGWSYVTGPEDDELDESSVPEASSEVETPEETAALQEQGADEAVDKEEKAKGFKAFIQKILAIFKRHKADETPYEEGSTEAASFKADQQADSKDLPVDPNADSSAIAKAANKLADVISGKSGKDADEGKDDDSSWYQSHKKMVWIGVGVLVLIGGVWAYKKYAK